MERRYEVRNGEAIETEGPVTVKVRVPGGVRVTLWVEGSESRHRRRGPKQSRDIPLEIQEPNVDSNC